jgi:signal transduction histidine kinase
MTLNLKSGDFNAFIREIAEFTAYELSDAEVDLELELDENLPFLEFDGQVMKQALLNLIQNAQAAMPEGGTITVKTEQKDNNAVISIADTGTGIDEKDLAKIFDPYFTTKEQGSGLGLTMVFKIIREHRGDITVDSKERKGTCFTITLPIVQRELNLLASDSESRHYAVQLHPESREEI